jgi:glycerol-3-phosphate dehydrogenase
MRPGCALLREHSDVSVLIVGGGINGIGLTLYHWLQY